MQRAVFQDTTPIHFQSQATRLLPAQDAGMLDEAVNDDKFGEGQSPSRMTLAVLANVVGGTLLLSGMIFLPHLLAGILG